MKRIIRTKNAPEAIGPYNQAVEANGTLYVSGQLPLNPADGSMPTTIEEQTEQALKNIGAILHESGYRYEDVVKATVFLADLNDFQAMNEVYAKFFTKNMPARIACQVARLPKNAKIEIDVIAAK